MSRYIGILNGASLAGVGSYILFLAYIYLWQVNPQGGVKFIGLLVPAIFMYLSIKRFREQEGEGFLSYRQGFALGSIFTLIYASLCAMLTFLHAGLIDSTFMDWIIQEDLEGLGVAKEFILEYGGRDAYEEALTNTQNIGVSDVAFRDFFSKAFGGSLLALVIAGIVRKKAPIFEPPHE